MFVNLSSFELLFYIQIIFHDVGELYIYLSMYYLPKITKNRDF